MKNALSAWAEKIRQSSSGGWYQRMTFCSWPTEMGPPGSPLTQMGCPGGYHQAGSRLTRYYVIRSKRIHFCFMYGVAYFSPVRTGDPWKKLEPTCFVICLVFFPHSFDRVSCDDADRQRMQ